MPRPMLSYRTSHCVEVRFGSATSKVIMQWERRPLLGTVQSFGSCCCEAVSRLYVQWTTSPKACCSSGPYHNSQALQACCGASKALAHQAWSAQLRTGRPAGLRMGAGLTDVTRTGRPAGLRMGAGLTDVTATGRARLSTKDKTDKRKQKGGDEEKERKTGQSASQPTTSQLPASY